VTDPKPGSREVLIDDTAIRTWAETHGAVPIRSRAESGVPVGFSFADDPDDRIEWTRFFTAFENGRLALLVDGADFAFVDRDRVADTGGEPDLTDERRTERRRASERHYDEVVDPQANHRADEAAEQENVDNHRDDEPFQS
jgi:hypothetical protein